MCTEKIISAVALDGWDRSVPLIDSFTPATSWIRGWVGSKAKTKATEMRKSLSAVGNQTKTPRSSSPYSRQCIYHRPRNDLREWGWGRGAGLLDCHWWERQTVPVVHTNWKHQEFPVACRSECTVRMFSGSVLAINNSPRNFAHAHLSDS